MSSEGLTMSDSNQASSKGLTMTHSKQIDPYRKICSLATVQPDSNGYFSKIVEQIKETSNYENVLLQVKIGLVQEKCKINN